MKRTFLMMTVVLIFILTIFTSCGTGTSSLEDVKWVLKSYGPATITKPLLPDTQVTVFFDSETKEVRGSGGCNTYFGNYEVDGKNLTILRPIAVTEMWCGDEIGEQEATYLEILQAAEKYYFVGERLYIEADPMVLIFERE